MKYVDEVQSKNDCVGEVRRPKNKTIIKCTFSSEFLFFFFGWGQKWPKMSKIGSKKTDK